MPASVFAKKSVIGTGLPYVFTESIKITKGEIRSEKQSLFDAAQIIKKDDYGNTIRESQSELQNKNFFSNDNVYKVDLTLFLNDFNSTNFWYGKGQPIYVKVIQSCHPFLTDQILKNDVRSLDLFDRKYRKFLKEQTLLVPTDKPLFEYRTSLIKDVDDFLCSIPVTTSFIANSEHLTYFIFAEQAGTIRKSYRTIEKVLDGGVVNRRATTFQLPGGSVYAGPVHFHPSTGWMVGERHTNRPHARLKKIDHVNLKIQDYRIFDRLKENHNLLDLSPSAKSGSRYYSDLFLSRDAAGSARGLFVFDCMKYIRENAKYGSLLKFVEPNKILKGAEIRDIKIVRSKVSNKQLLDFDNKDQTQENEVVANSSDNPGSIRLKSSNYYIDTNSDGKKDYLSGGIREQRLFNLGTRRAFSFYDRDIRNFESGKYSYGVEITIKDPTIDYLSSQINFLNQASNLLSEYRRFVTSYCRFDKYGKIPLTFMSTIRSKYNIPSSIGDRSKEAPWRKAIRTYLQVVNNLTGTSYSDNNIELLHSLVSPTSRDLKGVESLLQTIDELISKLTKDTLGYFRKETVSTRRGSRKGVGNLFTNKKFDNIFHADTIDDYGFNFFGTAVVYDSLGLPAVTYADLQERFGLESRKKNLPLPAVSTSPQSRQFYSRLTPVSVSLSDRGYDLSESSSSRIGNQEFNARVKILRLKSNPGARSVSVPELGAKPGSPEEEMQIGRLYLDYLATRGEGVSIESLTAQTQAAGLETDSTMPGGENDNFNRNRNKARKREENEKQNDALDSTSLEQIDQIIRENDDILADDKGVSVRYGTSFNENLELEEVFVPYFSNEPYLAILKVDDKSGSLREEDLYDSTILVGQASPQQEETASTQEFPEVSDGAPLPPPEEEVADEYGQSEDSNPDVYYSINYIEDVDTESGTLVSESAASESIVQVEPSLTVSNGQQQSFVRGVAPSSGLVARQSVPTSVSAGTSGGGGSAY